MKTDPFVTHFSGWKTAASVCLVILIMITGCDKTHDVKSFLEVPGYRTRCRLAEEFNEPESKWKMEGAGFVQILQDSGLSIEPINDSLGVIIWLNEDFGDDYLLEYSLNLPDTAGTHLLFVSAAGLDGKNLFKLQDSRTGSLRTYTEGTVRNYQVSMHAYSPDGQHIPYSRLRKNPGNLMLSHVDRDPCQANREYIIDFIKIGNRLQLYVDGERIHDYRDKGDRTDLYNKGKIGFWFQGRPGAFRAMIKHIRVFELYPK